MLPIQWHKVRVLFVLLFSLLFSVNLFSQDSLSVIPKKKNTYKPAFDFDQRFSFIANKKINIWGYRGGVLVNEKFKVGFGAYFSKDKFKSISIDSGGSPTYYGFRDFYFGTAYFEPFIFRYKFLEFSLPFEIGAGKSVFKAFDNSTNAQVSRVARYFVPTGAGLSLSFKLPPIGRFKPTRWFGINFLAGYRYCMFQGQLEKLFPQRFDTDYNGMFWSVSGALFLDRVSDDYKVFHHKRMAKKANKNLSFVY